MLVKEWSRSKSLIDAGISIVLKRLSIWMAHLKAAEVEITVHRREVTLNDRSLIAQIRSSNPSLISWSNVSDYLHPSDFFGLCKAVSVPGRTLHRFYSMNWIQSCFGSFILDYPKEQRKPFITAAAGLLKEEYKKLGVCSLLTDTVVDNAINTSSYFLSKRYYSRWLQSFLSFGGVERCVSEEISYYSIFARGQATVFVTFAFQK